MLSFSFRIDPSMPPLFFFPLFAPLPPPFLLPPPSSLFFSSSVFLFFLLMRNDRWLGQGLMRWPLYVWYPASPLRSPSAVSSRCIYCFIPTPHHQFFVHAQVSPLSRLSLLICVSVRVRVCVCVRVGVGPMHIYPLCICCYAALTCPGCNHHLPSSFQSLSPPP